ncbi:MAG: energy-coupling factor transporter transmembrane component T [candidate division Zixibacteria bacterium]|nr:energy-coupling factor transporter transmembrane component T [candidate division Zixibacteria bacterium]
MFESAPILLGQYRPHHSYLHRLDARAKMVPVTVILILALMTSSYLFYIVILSTLFVGLLQSGVTPAKLIGNFRPILILALITSLYHLVFSGVGTEVLFKVFGFGITIGAVEMAGFYSLRLILFVSIAFLVTLTSSPSELADAFARILSPLHRLRIPVQDLALILFMAIRFIPVLYEEFITIRNAQIIRGVRFSGSVFSRIKKTVCIIIPVFVSALQRADELALAIGARGYRGDVQRTSYSRMSFGLREWVFVTVATVAVVGLFLVTYCDV